ncbi:hypothetical protein [Dyadobacter sediminis]|nr:hypothetical protein [Dyadobacter sediminis]
MNKENRLLPGILMTLPVLLWVTVLLYYSVNVPWFDDYDPFPDFLDKWISGGSFSEQLKLLFQPNNEHRMVIGKMITLVYYQLTGHLDFTFLHIAGACFTLGTFAVFWKAFRKSRLKWWFFLPVPFLLFQLQYHLVFLWAICSLQHQPVIFFVCLSMFLLAKRQFAWAVLAALCATYAMSNGIFVWVSGAGILMLRSDYRRLATWLAAGAFAIGFYFYGLSAQGNESSIEFFIKNPHLSVLGFFAFLGGLFDFFPEKSIVTRSVLPVLAGFVTMIWIVIWLLRQITPFLKKTFRQSEGNTLETYGKTADLNRFLLGILIFLLVNALVIGLLRPRFGFFVMIVSNYKMYPALFLIVAYLSFITSSLAGNVRKRGFQLAFAISILIWGISVYTYLPGIAERQKYLTINGYNQKHNAFGLGHIPFSQSAAYVDSLMKRMTASHIYTYPEEPERIAEQVLLLQNKMGPRNISVFVRDKVLYVDEPDYRISLARNDGQFVYMKNEKHLYFFKSNAHLYAGRNLFRQYDAGSNTTIPFSSVEQGTYDLGIIRVRGEKTERGLLRKITIP